MWGVIYEIFCSDPARLQLLLAVAGDERVQAPWLHWHAACLPGRDGDVCAELEEQLYEREIASVRRVHQRGDAVALRAAVVDAVAVHAGQQPELRLPASSELVWTVWVSGPDCRRLLGDPRRAELEEQLAEACGAQAGAQAWQMWATLIAVSIIQGKEKSAGRTMAWQHRPCRPNRRTSPQASGGPVRLGPARPAAAASPRAHRPTTRGSRLEVP